MLIKLTKKVIALAIIFCMPLTVMAETVMNDSGNWGLGYGVPGEKPTGNATADELRVNNAYYVGDGDEKVIYLTFDAGYENGYTDEILNVLKEEEVPATFFLVGTYIRDNPDIVRRMVNDGHIVGNHTMSHPDMSAISDKDSFVKELAQTEEQYLALIGEEMPKYYRPPQGKYSEENLKMAAELGYTTVFWSLAYVDWNVDEQPTKEQAFEKLLPRIHSGAVLLLHSTSETNAKILKELITEYRALGYEFKSLDNLKQ